MSGRVDGLQRLDVLLKQGSLSALSRTRIRELVLSSFVCVDGLIQTNPAKYFPQSSVVKVLPYDQNEVLGQKKNANTFLTEGVMEVVFEDDNCAVINKSSGISVHCGHDKNEVTLVDHLVHTFGRENLANVRGDDCLGIVHRLDKETSGLMLIAKNNHSHEFLTHQITSRSCKRKYLALCYGTFMPPFGLIKKYLSPDRKDFRKYIASDTAGKESSTEYLVKKVFLDGAISLVEFSLLTGRTHQIRVHSLSKGHPILGDNLYKDQSCNRLLVNVESEIKQKILFGLRRQMLHAYKISFIPYEGSSSVEVEVDMPSDMEEVIKMVNV